MSSINEKPKYGVNTVVGLNQNAHHELEEDQLIECFKTMILKDVRSIYVKKGNNHICFTKENKTYSIWIVEKLFLSTLDVILQKPLDTARIQGNVTQLKTLDSKTQTASFSLSGFSRIPQASFLLSLIQNTFLTELEICEFSDENFAALALCLKGHEGIKVLRVAQPLSKECDKLLLDVLIHQCYLSSLKLTYEGSPTLIDAVIRYAASLKQLGIFTTGCPPQFVWQGLRENVTLQELNITANGIYAETNIKAIANEVANLKENVALQKVIVNCIDLREYLLMNLSNTEIAIKEKKPDVRVLDGFTKEALEEWMQSEDAKDARVLVITRLVINFLSL